MKIDKNTFQLLKSAPNTVYNDLKPLFLYHSNKLEGSTFTEDEIINLINNKKVSGEHEIDDFYETRNSIKVFDFVIDTLGEEITDEYLIKINTDLLCDTWTDREGLTGTYKKVPNRIPGASFEVSMPKDVSLGMKDLLKQYNNKKLNITDIAKFHARFEHIHPFQDGNGRTGRFIILKQCIENDIDQIFINSDNRKTYLAWLEVAITQNEFGPLISFFRDTQKELDTELTKRKIKKLIPSASETISILKKKKQKIIITNPQPKPPKPVRGKVTGKKSVENKTTLSNKDIFGGFLGC